MNICKACTHHYTADYTRHICKHPDVQRIDYISGNPITILCESVRKDNSPECPLFKPNDWTTK